MDYSLIKAIHLSAVALSFSGFILRGGGVLASARWAQSRAARTLPHIIDTVLLVSAVSLALMLRINPFEQPWLAAKIIALLLYIVLGTVALKSESRVKSATAYAAALSTFAYIVAVALSKSAIPW